MKLSIKLSKKILVGKKLWNPSSLLSESIFHWNCKLIRRTHTQSDTRRATQYLLRSLSDGEGNNMAFKFYTENETNDRPCRTSTQQHRLWTARGTPCPGENNRQMYECPQYRTLPTHGISTRTTTTSRSSWRSLQRRKMHSTFESRSFVIMSCLVILLV